MNNKLVYFGLGAGLGIAIAAIVTLTLMGLVARERIVSTNRVAHDDVHQFEKVSNGLSYDTETVAIPPFQERIIPKLQSTSSFDRPLVIHKSLEKLDSSRLLQVLAEPGEAIDERYLDEILRAVVSRLAITNPSAVLDAIAKLPHRQRAFLTPIVFQEWFIADQDRALKHAKTLDDTTRTMALAGIMNSRINLNISELREIVLRLDLEDQLSLGIELLSRDEVGNPVENWIDLVSLQANDVRLLDDLRLQSFSNAARSLIEVKESDAIQTIESSLVQLKSTVVVGQILTSIARVDSSLALELAKNLDVTSQNTIEQIVRIYAKQDPLGALNAASEWDFIDRV